VRRGEIWWASLPTPARSGPGFRRPVLVIQSDDFNKSAIRTVLVAAITSNTRLAGAPGNVALPKRTGKLSKKSVINVSQVLTIDRSFLTERMGSVSSDAMKQVDEGLRLVMAL
jgi:mRNA interferase MazF